LRKQLTALTGASSEKDIALLKNTTEGISVVAGGLNWQAGDNMVLPVGEFPSNRLPWLAQAGRGVTIREIDIREAENAEDALLEAFDDRTRLLSVSAVQWNDGFRLDLARLGRACRAKGVLFFVDAIQQLGALPVDVEQCQIDFLAADAHKWLLGPEGIAVFYCRERIRPQLQLHQLGWHMADNPWNFNRSDVRPSATAKRFEAGSPNTLGQVALHASLELLLGVGMDRVAECVMRNSRFLVEELSQLPRIQVTSRIDPQRLSGTISFLHRDLPSRKLHGLLTNAGITTAVRGNSIRVSPHFYQDETDLCMLIKVLKQL
jgi:selenocysteine lyase/cysteine desulfurase